MTKVKNENIFFKVTLNLTKYDYKILTFSGVFSFI